MEPCAKCGYNSTDLTVIDSKGTALCSVCLDEYYNPDWDEDLTDFFTDDFHFEPVQKHGDMRSAFDDIWTGRAA